MINEDTLTCFITGLNESWPVSYGIPGRLKSCTNVIAKHWVPQPGAPTALKLEKRNGFGLLPTLVRDPSSGLVSSKPLGGMTMLGTYGKQLIAICTAAPFVLSEAAG